MSTERLAEIESRASVASKGPWRWHGNTDSHTWSLENREWVVMTLTRVERTANDREVEEIVHYLCEVEPARRGFDWDDEAACEARLADIRERALDMWLACDEITGVPRTDHRLFIKGGEGIPLAPLEAQVVYEVCPDAVERDDPRVYRADFKLTRSGDAEFIAHARADVDWLLAEVRRLQSLLRVARRTP